MPNVADVLHTTQDADGEVRQVARGHPVEKTQRSGHKRNPPGAGPIPGRPAAVDTPTDGFARDLRMNCLMCSLLVALTVAGCAAKTATETRSQAQGRNVAARFAAAVLRGDAVAARSLLVGGDKAALVYLVQRATAPWRSEHASIQLPARRVGSRWTFSYLGRRTRPDGSFETERGDLVVFVAGASVRFFVFAHVHMRFSTHHDAQLLPSNR